MYLKYLRKGKKGTFYRGTLYKVSFAPNKIGGYTERRHRISDVYEVSWDAPPSALVYPVSVRKIDGRLRVAFGVEHRQSLLHLIDRHAGEPFLIELRYALLHHEDVRLEVLDN